MLALRVDLLTGRYAATAYNEREQVEWPPHPARLFSALVATWAEDEPGTAAADAELDALRWLEVQAAPEILASAVAVAGKRTPAIVFVPVNDVGVIKMPDHDKLVSAEHAVAVAASPAARAQAEKQVSALTKKLAVDTAKEVAVPAKFGKHDAQAAEQSLIERRVRQPRSFPCAVPELPAFAFVWRDVEAPAALALALARLAQRLVRVGHSSSLVHARLVASLDDLVPSTRFVPDDDGDLMIRWTGHGQLDRLVRAHRQHQQVEPRVLPARFVRYREGARAAVFPPARSVFDLEWVVFARASGPRLPITSAAGLSRQFRRALMSVADEPIPELLSGHRPEGTPSDQPHLAVVPLPAVTGPHPDGALLGLALVLPHEVSAIDRAAVMRAVGRLARADGAGGDPVVLLQLSERDPLMLERVVWGEHPLTTLRAHSWTRAARRWASATPVALDRNPGDFHDADPAARARAFEAARASIFEAVRRIGLPAPVEVDVVRSCVLPGTAKPRAYPRFPSATHKPQRVLVHVRLVFGEAVRGPVLLGSGRYQGLGLCAPVDGDARGRS